MPAVWGWGEEGQICRRMCRHETKYLQHCLNWGAGSVDVQNHRISLIEAGISIM